MFMLHAHKARGQRHLNDDLPFILSVDASTLSDAKGMRKLLERNGYTVGVTRIKTTLVVVVEAGDEWEDEEED